MLAPEIGMFNLIDTARGGHRCCGCFWSMPTPPTSPIPPPPLPPPQQLPGDVARMQKCDGGSDRMMWLAGGVQLQSWGSARLAANLSLCRDTGPSDTPVPPPPPVLSPCDNTSRQLWRWDPHSGRLASLQQGLGWRCRRPVISVQRPMRRQGASDS